MRVSIVDSPAHSPIPYWIRLYLAEAIQSERPYSPREPKDLVFQMDEATADGCVAVLVYTDDGVLVGGGEIILLSSDFHVGDCFAYLWSWVHPDYRHGEVARILVRTIRHITRQATESDWYMLTRQCAPQVFKVTYTQVKNNG